MRNIGQNVTNFQKPKKDKPIKFIRDIPAFDRPREKMIKKGAGALSNLELLVALLGIGIKGRDVFEIASDIARISEKHFNHLTVEKLKSINGVGTAKACQVLAALEYARRFLTRERIRIKSDKDVIPLVLEMSDRKQEYFLTLTLDGANNFIQKRTVFIGTLNQSLIHPREVFADAVADRAAGIILVHNHPSGDCTPSKEDFDVTDRLVKAGKIMGIDIMDHIIISRNGYYSFQKNGYFR